MSTPIDISSNILQLKQLELQYKTKINEYKTAYASYITTTQSQTDQNSYVVLPGKVYSGATNISNTTNSTTDNCQALCSANTSCTGATFNSISKMCSLFKGKGTLVNGGSSDNTIIKKLNQQLIALDAVNSQLIDINNQMMAIVNKIQPSVKQNIATLSTNDATLIANSESLKKEQRAIKKLLNEYNDIDQNYINQTLNVDKRNASYYLWLVITIVAVFLALKFVLFPEARGNIVSIILWSIIIICIILGTINLKNPAVYGIWVALVALVLMMKAKIIPSI
jgi:hypothetical protein